MAFVKDRPRGFIRKTISRMAKAVGTLFAGYAVLAEPGCTRDFYGRAPETVVYVDNNHANLSATELGFRQGETTQEEAVRTMEGKGLTHVVEDINVPIGGEGETVSAVMADFQHSVHIFLDRRYDESVELDIERGEMPHRYTLRVADYEDGKIILVLIRDAIRDLEGYSIEPIRLALVPYSNGETGEPSYSDLSSLEREREGLQYPLFVGYDLEGGVTFIARDKKGMPWEQGYIISFDGSRLHWQPVSFIELMQCDCVGDWAREHDE